MRSRVLIAATLLVLASGLSNAQDRKQHPSEDVPMALVELKHEFDLHETGFLGIELLTTETKGESAVLVSAVTQGTGADAAGILPDDQLLVVNGRRIATYPDLTQAMNETRPGQSIEVRVLREGREHDLNVVLGNRREAKVLLERFPQEVATGKWLAVLRNPDAAFGAETQALSQQLASYFGVDGGVLVSHVIPEGPADLAGLLAGDVIVGWEDEAVLNGHNFSRLKSTIQPGVELRLTVQRHGAALKLFVVPDEIDDVDVRVKTDLLLSLREFKQNKLHHELKSEWVKAPAGPGVLLDEIKVLETRIQELQDKLTALDR